MAVLKEKLKLNHIDMDYIQNHLVADESIYMSGDGINDDIFRLLADSDGLSRTKELRLFNTSISEESINLLSTLTHLSRINFEKKNELRIKDALIRLKKNHPSLAIEFNRARIRL